MTTAATTHLYRGYSSNVEEDLRAVRNLAHLLDEAFRIPYLNTKVGLDSILSLVPIIGSVSGFALSGYILYKAVRLGVPLKTLIRMLFIALLDLLIGSIPVIGPVFDMFWKANLRNVRLIEAYLSAS